MVHCVNRVIKVVFRPASEGFSLRRQDMQHGGHGAQMTQHQRKGGRAQWLFGPPKISFHY